MSGLKTSVQDIKTLNVTKLMMESMFYPFHLNPKAVTDNNISFLANKIATNCITFSVLSTDQNLVTKTSIIVCA